MSGIQPTGIPHLGNYLGAIKPWKKLQKDELFISIVDLHAITVHQDPNTLRKNTKEMAQSLLACGLSPKNIIFRQSRIHQHAELAWLLSCRTPVGWLQRMHQWKTKGGDDGHIGLLSYPILQAADILLYKATAVPVGEDQSQHMNLTSMITKSFNSTYKKQVFPVPKALYTNAQGKRIMSLKDPTKKMSKSDPNLNSSILITDSDIEIQRKIRKAVTDSIDGIYFDQDKRPGVSNLLNIVMALREIDEIVELEREFSELSNSEFKNRVADELIAYFEPIRKRFKELNDQAYLDGIMETGEEKARMIATTTISEVYQCVGLQ
jgi:tryptophanyl-tRNA synthetase